MPIIKRLIFIIFFTTLANQINAEEVKKLGKHKDWETYVINSATGKVCFAQSKPVLQAPKNNKREARMFISFRPGENVTNEISITSGYDYNTKILLLLFQEKINTILILFKKVLHGSQIISLKIE